MSIIADVASARHGAAARRKKKTYAPREMSLLASLKPIREYPVHPVDVLIAGLACLLIGGLLVLTQRRSDRTLHQSRRYLRLLFIGSGVALVGLFIVMSIFDESPICTF